MKHRSKGSETYVVGENTCRQREGAIVGDTPSTLRIRHGPINHCQIGNTDIRVGRSDIENAITGICAESQKLHARPDNGHIVTDDQLSRCERDYARDNIGEDDGMTSTQVIIIEDSLAQSAWTHVIRATDHESVCASNKREEKKAEYNYERQTKAKLKWTTTCENYGSHTTEVCSVANGVVC